MDTLDGTSWDVIISGTGLPQSLLALALSRSGKRILHVDRNDYYGGNEAALSLSDAESWASRHAASSSHASSSFSNASLVTTTGQTDQNKLAHSRAYSLALAPQLLYTRSSLLSALVSSQTHNQLEFQAVGSWFVVPKPSQDGVKLIRVPGGREDVFQDSTLDLKAKRNLMKFLRFVASSEEQRDLWAGDEEKSFSSLLLEKFGLPESSHAPIIALTLSRQPLPKTTVANAIPRISRHLGSIGLFGPGFGAVVPKWGGLAEIAQVACRACAVGGGVYVLGKGVDKIGDGDGDGPNVSVHLSGGEKVAAEWLVGDNENLPAQPSAEDGSSECLVSESIFIMSTSLPTLFPPTSEGGPIPAGAVVLVPSSDDNEPPVHIFVHSSESGECPSGQSVLYASISKPCENGFARLDDAVRSLLQSVAESVMPELLWNMKFQRRYTKGRTTRSAVEHVVTLKALSEDPAFDDAVLQDVKAAWEQIAGADPETFLKFEAREGTFDEDGSS